ncbi:MAG: quiP [Marmoricola sp.]|nr:quiP [Marmoricola sp.]
MITVNSSTDVPAADERTRFRDWPTGGRWLVYSVILLVIAMIALFLAGATVVRRSLPQTSGTLQLRGLTSTVDVDRDANGIAQVYADTPADLFYAQGYVQAQDRFWEMDFRRHVTSGRLSELLGKKALSTDMYIRTMGWRDVAQKEYALLSPDSRSYLDAYSAGVNAYIHVHSISQMSLEYSLLAIHGLNYTPEDWTPVDSLAWLKAMAWDLRGNMDDEIDRARLSVDRTPDQIAELYPPYPYATNQPIMDWKPATPPPTGANPRPPLGSAAMKALEAVERGTAAIPDLLGSGDGIGSNSWVVSGAHTVSGKPLLANDPHLSPSLPGIWYQMGLHCRVVDESCPFDVSGFTFAGVPGVMIGHNDKIAWGFTNLDPDVTDLYLEKVEGQNYLYDNKWLPLKEHDETIKVAGGKSKTFTVRATGHGPLVSDVSSQLSSVGANASSLPGSPPRGNGYAVSLEWTALTPSRTADAIFLLDRAQDWTQFRAAAARFAVPSQNLVYADTDGNIGYQAPGLIPIRKGNRSGDYPVEGWNSANDWSGKYVPFKDLPTELNPDDGFIVTANQAVTGPNYPYFLSDSWDQGYRSQRIRQLLTKDFVGDQPVGVAEMSRIQNDTRNPMAPILVPYLLNILLTSEYYADGQRLLATWDYTQPADSAAAAYFNAVWSNLLRLTFQDQLKKSLWPDGGQRWMAVVSELLQEPDSPWWDDVRTDGVIENRDTILTTAMQDARDELVRRISVDPDKWQWGALHQLKLTNQSLGASGIGVVERLFNRGPYDVAGGGSNVDATAWDAAKGYAVTAAPSMRMVVDLSDFDNSRWINQTGVSGHAFSAHYTDQTKLWLAGETLPWVSSKTAVQAATRDHLNLVPRSN